MTGEPSAYDDLFQGLDRPISSESNVDFSQSDLLYPSTTFSQYSVSIFQLLIVYPRLLFYKLFDYEQSAMAVLDGTTSKDLCKYEFRDLDYRLTNIPKIFAISRASLSTSSGLYFFYEFMNIYC